MDERPDEQLPRSFSHHLHRLIRNMKRVLLYPVFPSLSPVFLQKDDGNFVAAGGPTPYSLVIPQGLPQLSIPVDNPLTVEGVSLGKRLFYDPILSGDNTISCASCHRQQYAFTDSTLQFSIGIDLLPGTRNAMPLFNLGYARNFFWDGGATNLESQVIGPIMNPVEMHEDLANCIAELQAHPEYPLLFYKAFKTDSITTALLMKAVAQFERTILSAGSKYDAVQRARHPLRQPSNADWISLPTSRKAIAPIATHWEAPLPTSNTAIPGLIRLRWIPVGPASPSCLPIWEGSRHHRYGTSN